MMTLEELWENLRQDPEIKATTEEADKSYKLFKKIENLIVADLEAKLAESENRVKDLEFRNKNLEHSLSVAPNANAGQRARIVELKEINHKLKQQLAEKDKEIEEIKKGVYKVTLGTTPSNQIDFTENFYVIQNQTAITELEKVKAKVRDVSGALALCEVEVQIDQQIKELKGEK